MARFLVMAKAPVPGAVKTRLRLAPEKAARLQEALIQDTVRKARNLGPTIVAGTPPESLGLISSLLPDGARLIPQTGEDLGERMLAAAARLFGEDMEPVVILGTDAPTLPPECLEEATRALETHDVALVPSTDGGYVLLGLRKLHKALFTGIAWSTSAVHRQTLEKARRANLSVLEQEPWYDVDTPEDLQRLEKELSGEPERASSTAEVLKDL